MRLKFLARLNTPQSERLLIGSSAKLGSLLRDINGFGCRKHVERYG